MATRGMPAIPKRCHAITRFNCKLLMLFFASFSFVVVLSAIFCILHYSNSNTSKLIRSRISLIFNGPSKIAFLFLVRRNLPLDFLWGTFFQNGDVANFSIYVHSVPEFVLNESTTKSHFFYGRQLSNSIQVLWGESSMIQAERLLLAAALEDLSNQRFILLRQLCSSVQLYPCVQLYHEFSKEFRGQVEEGFGS